MIWHGISLKGNNGAVFNERSSCFNVFSSNTSSCYFHKLMGCVVIFCNSFFSNNNFCFL